MSVPSIPPLRVVCSVPSFHSAKPQLDSMMSRYRAVPAHPRGLSRCHSLELFARVLRPGLVSIGNECLRFQDIREYYCTKAVDDVNK